MAAYVIFIKERTHNQGQLDLYREMAATPALSRESSDHIPASRTDKKGSR